MLIDDDCFMKPCRGISVRFTAKEGAVDRVTTAPGGAEESNIWMMIVCKIDVRRCQ